MQIGDLFFSCASWIFFKRLKEDNQRHGQDKFESSERRIYDIKWKAGRQHDNQSIHYISLIHNILNWLTVPACTQVTTTRGLDTCTKNLACNP